LIKEFAVQATRALPPLCTKHCTLTIFENGMVKITRQRKQILVTSKIGTQLPFTFWEITHPFSKKRIDLGKNPFDEQGWFCRVEIFNQHIATMVFYKNLSNPTGKICTLTLKYRRGAKGKRKPIQVIWEEGGSE